MNIEVKLIELKDSIGLETNRFNRGMRCHTFIMSRIKTL